MHKYKIVYVNLWLTYGQSWSVRTSYILQFIGRMVKLIVLPLAISMIITNLSKQNYSGAYRGVVFFVSFSFLLGLITTIVRLIGLRGENTIYAQETASYFQKLVLTDIEYFNSNLSGYLTSATRDYVDSSIAIVRHLRNQYMTTILSILFPVCVILWFNTILGLVTVFLCVAMAIFMILASRKIDSYRKRSRELHKINSGKISDTISNILAIKSTAQENNCIKQVKINATTEARAFTRRFIVQAKFGAYREFFTVLTFLILLSLTVKLMSSGSINITTAVLVITYTATILTGIYSLSGDIDEHDDLVDKILPAFDILNRQNIIQDKPNPIALRNIKGDIEFDSVDFAYNKAGEQDVFRNFSLSIPHGQKLGVVGLSGSGKSTLTKLLLRFNDVDNGRVLIDGIDIRDVRQTDLRRNIAYVPQEPILFHTSIHGNVSVSRPDASNEQIEHALKSAHASQFVSKLSDGIDSVVGERGVKLSGGQKQRIAIARAVLQDAPIFILDEATSALDSESEQIIKDSFTDILRGKTAIVAAHRLSTLSDMDRIIVIEKGHIVEDGTHQQLVDYGGVYAKLWKHQQRFTS